MGDPDLQIRRGEGAGGGHPEPEIRGGGLQKHFSALRASVLAKKKRGGRETPGPFPRSATDMNN